MSDEEREPSLEEEEEFKEIEEEDTKEDDEHDDEYFSAEEGEGGVEEDDDHHEVIEEDDDHHEYLTKHFPGLLQAIKTCTKETDVKCIDIGNLSLETTHLKAIFNLLPNTKIVEFKAESNDLRSGMPEFTRQLTKSNVKKLSFKNCKLQVVDVLTLMQALQTTRIIDLDLSSLSFVALYSRKSMKVFDASLKKSHLTHLRLTGSSLLGHPQGKSALGKHLASSLSKTCITHLWLEETGFRQDAGALKTLFTNLPTTFVTELYLGCNEIKDDQLKPLCDNLKQSKLEVLNLRSNKISDAGINLLSEALVGSKVRELVVAANNISGANTLGKRLKDTSITILHLGWNELKNHNMFSFPDFLKDTSVTELRLDSCDLGDEVAQSLVKCLKSSKVTKVTLSGNRLGLPTASKFVRIVKKTRITEVDLSENDFSAEALQVLGEGIEGSKLKHFTLRGELKKLQEGSPMAAFIDKTRGTALESLDISYTNFENESAILATSLKNTTLTHLNLSSCQIGAGIADLAPALKHTAITHLNLSKNKIDDVGAEKLAASLKETNIFQLEALYNVISNKGAKALVLCVKSGPLYRLNLEQNKITDEGIKELAQMIEGTFITNVEVCGNFRSKTLPLKTVIWRNQPHVQKLVRFFKTIFPTASGDNAFRFDSEVDDVNFNMFVEKCLLLYKAALRDPSAVSALANDDDIPFSRQEVAGLVEAFPAQFMSFIQSKNKIKVEQHIKFLERAQVLGLDEIIKFFLSKLVDLIIRQKKGILRPATYELVAKHKESLCNLKLEAEDKEKVIQYFIERPTCCGLCGKTRKLTKTECCDNWICEDDDKYVVMSFARNCCYRNHQKYTLCSLHHENKHKGRWQACKKCKDKYLTENYIDYVTNDFNFEKMQNVTPVTIKCYVCGFQSQTLKDFGCQNGSLFFCEKKECQDVALQPGLPNSSYGIPMIVPLYKYKTECTPETLNSMVAQFPDFPFAF